MKQQQLPKKHGRYRMLFGITKAAAKELKELLKEMVLPGKMGCLLLESLALVS